MDADSERLLISLLHNQRTAVLATTREGEPNASLVLFAALPDFSAFIIHTSRLSQHTGNMLADARVSLLIAQTDSGEQDPQTLARITIQAQAQQIPREAPDFHSAARLYLGKFPAARSLFELGDFSLFSLLPRKARYVAGFARAFNLQPAALRRLAEQPKST